jgi:hypothetical protein
MPQKCPIGIGSAASLNDLPKLALIIPGADTDHPNAFGVIGHRLAAEVLPTDLLDAVIVDDTLLARKLKRDLGLLVEGHLVNCTHASIASIRAKMMRSTKMLWSMTFCLKLVVKTFIDLT